MIRICLAGSRFAPVEADPHEYLHPSSGNIQELCLLLRLLLSRRNEFEWVPATVYLSITVNPIASLHPEEFRQSLQPMVWHFPLMHFVFKEDSQTVRSLLTCRHRCQWSLVPVWRVYCNPGAIAFPFI